MPKFGYTKFRDIVRGDIVFDNAELDDFIIMRSDKSPTYNLCVVIDDNFSNITHIIRGDDHLNNTPKQIRIYEALNFKIPKYVHLPMILDSNGKKISKTQNDFDITSFFKKGYLPQAMFNYLLRLGWSHKNQEIFSLEESKKLFSFKNLQKSSAHNNFEKLDWLNKHYLKKTPEQDLLRYFQNYLTEKKLSIADDKVSLLKVLHAQKHRFSNFDNIINNSLFFFSNFRLEVNESNLLFLKKYKVLLQEILNYFNTLLMWKKELIYECIKTIAKNKKADKNTLLKVVRISVTGKTESPPINLVVETVGKQQTIERIEKVLNLIEK